ncbi:DUF6328 family protein [Pseudonocardia xishanensis]|uniref:DUF6328 family protein n=1 Tax=Pseudonocardia xishanensis TaxID=630995 RepID=A0ABP8S015_9PSEU
MTPNGPPADESWSAHDTWNAEARGETPTERLDRNWSALLQELRVAQTGVQLLTGLLLTVPFQARFVELATHQRVLYLIATSLSVLATGLLISPVMLHRVLFRQRGMALLVGAAQVFAIAGLSTLGLAVTAVVGLIFEIVLGTAAGIVAGIAAVLLLALLWGAFPLAVRRRIPPVD